jgi:glycosyltransferase involved in cell wall biosynthesis
MLKVCIIGNEYVQQLPLINYGGIETAFEGICIGTSKYFKDKIKFCAIVPKILTQSDVQYDFPVIQADFIESSKSGLPRTLFAQKAAEIIKNSNIKPDIIWAQSAWAANYLSDLGIPMIITIHDSIDWSLFRDDMKLIYKENVFYKFVSKFIYDYVFQDADKNEEIRLVKSKSCWFTGGILDEEYDCQIQKENHILWVAGLNWGMERKGLDTFIRLAQERSDQTFVAYGTGDAHIESHLRDLSSRLHNFEYLGALQRGDIHKQAFKSAKMFALLSQTPEACARTGFESISKGTPILGSTKGSIPELYSPVGVCTDDFTEMVNVLDTKFDYQSVYDYSQKFHVKNDIQFLLDNSYNIINNNKLIE